MQSSNQPLVTKISIPFANDGDKTDIPETTVDPFAASMTLGFPYATSLPVEEGGEGPTYEDFNGIFYRLSDFTRWSAAGGGYKFNSQFATDVGGYPKGAVILKADESGYWLSTIDNNTNDPDVSGIGWQDLVPAPTPEYKLKFASLYPSIRTIPKAKAPIIDMVTMGPNREYRFAVVADNEIGSLSVFQAKFYFIGENLNFRGLVCQVGFNLNYVKTVDLSIAPDDVDGLYAFTLLTRGEEGASPQGFALYRYSRISNSVTDITGSVVIPVGGETCGKCAALVAEDVDTIYFATSDGTNVLIRKKIVGGLMSIVAELSAGSDVVDDISLAFDAAGDLYMLVCFSDQVSKLYLVTSTCTIVGSTEMPDFRATSGVIKIDGSNIFVAQAGLKVGPDQMSVTVQRYQMPGFMPTSAETFSYLDDAGIVKGDVYDGEFYAAVQSTTGGVQVIKIDADDNILKYAYCQPTGEETQGMGMSVGSKSVPAKVGYNKGLTVLAGSKKTSESSSFTATSVEYFSTLGE